MSVVTFSRGIESQKLLHHYQHKKISSVYQFILAIQPISESHDPGDHAHF